MPLTGSYFEILQTEEAKMRHLRGDHRHTECTKRDKPKCAACGGPHPAMARSCPKYALAKAATSISVTEGMLYSDALRMAQKDQHQASTTPESQTPETPTTTAAARTGGPARPESLCTVPSGESSRQRPKVVDRQLRPPLLCPTDSRRRQRRSLRAKPRGLLLMH